MAQSLQQARRIHISKTRRDRKMLIAYMESAPQKPVKIIHLISEELIFFISLSSVMRSGTNLTKK